MKENLEKLQEALASDNFDTIDYIVEYLQSPNITDDERDTIQDIIDEATLYIELKEEEYKGEALKLIWEYS